MSLLFISITHFKIGSQDHADGKILLVVSSLQCRPGIVGPHGEIFAKTVQDLIDMKVKSTSYQR
jgi:hypothetical protein